MLFEVQGLGSNSPLYLDSKSFPKALFIIKPFVTWLPIGLGNEGFPLPIALYCKANTFSNSSSDKFEITAEEIKPLKAVGYFSVNWFTLCICSGVTSAFFLLKLNCIFFVFPVSVCNLHQKCMAQLFRYSY